MSEAVTAADFAGRPLRHDPPAVQAGAGTHVDQPIGAAHDRLVVLDDQHAVAAALQLPQGVDQPLVVARVQADRRLVEHVAHADQRRSRCPVASRMRCNSPPLSVAAGRSSVR